MRIMRHVECRIFGGGSHRELVHVCFAKKDGALAAEFLDDAGVVACGVSRQYFGCGGGGEVFDEDAVFDGEWDSGEVGDCFVFCERVVNNIRLFERRRFGNA